MRRRYSYSTFVLGLGLVGCPAAPHVVQVVAANYALQAPDTVPAGLTQFGFANQGSVPHELAVGLLRANAGAQDMMDAGQKGLKLREGPEHYLQGAPFGVLFAWPGQTSLATMTVELQQGQNYALLCTLRDSTTAPEHAALGMVRVLHVR